MQIIIILPLPLLGCLSGSSQWSAVYARCSRYGTLTSDGMIREMVWFLPLKDSHIIPPFVAISVMAVTGDLLNIGRMWTMFYSVYVFY